jgi:hypothetical protein
MNLKEEIISSFFFHLILLLLMAAVSNYATCLFGGMQKIVSVDLAAEDVKDQPATPGDHADNPPPASRPASDGEMSLPEQAVSSPPERPKEIPEPEKKAESAAAPAKTEKAEIPAVQKEGFRSLEAYYQFIALHKEIFGQQAGARVNELLGAALKENTQEFYGGTAIVSLKFGPDGALNEVLVDSASPALKAFFEEIDWGIVPAPAAYSLGFTAVRIEFAVLEGYMSFNIDPR